MDTTISIENFQSTWSKDRLTAVFLVTAWLYVAATVTWRVLKEAVLYLSMITNRVIDKSSVESNDALSEVTEPSSGPVT